MKKYAKKCIAILVVEIVIVIIANMILVAGLKRDENRLYRVEAKRIEDRLKAGESLETINSSEYEEVLYVAEYVPGQTIKEDYLVVEASGTCYAVAYSVTSDFKVLVVVNVVCAAIILLSVGMFIYLGRIVIKPFESIKEMPYELSKGHLVNPIKEEKNKVFGRFLWGMDLLRENLEESREEELRLQKEKKTLLLSISHDIKTPLSSIKLYSKALSEDLYTEEDRRKESYAGIYKNAEDIEKYVNQIIKASKEDFLNLQVNNTEVYLSKVIASVKEHYADKLGPMHTAFAVADFNDCMVVGDEERLIEVIQNVMENAIKYGDGEYINISVSEEEDCKLIRVENSGTPIKDTELPHLFESFYRGSNTKDKKGSGLGLYICRTLMRMMDGDIYAEVLPKGNAFVVVARKA